jgi:hypothetical protein
MKQNSLTGFDAYCQNSAFLIIIIIVTLIDYPNKIIVFLLFQNIKNKMQDFNTFRLGEK